MPPVAGPELLGVGYEGQTLDELVAYLTILGVTVLVDVRLIRSLASPG